MLRTKVFSATAAIVALAMPSALNAQYAQKDSKDIVDVAAEAGSFETLLAAASAAGLVETLKSEGPFTIFAPTDEAFDKLPEGTVEALLENPDKLAAILKYHVVPGRIAAKDVIAAGSARPATAQGQSLNVRVVDGKVMVDDATVITADVAASNGVIHVIDTVVLPAE